jgi:predicted RNA methylase
MAKLSKQDSKRHDEAEALVVASKTRLLTFIEREFVVENWNPAARHNVTRHSVFFTPMDMASALAIETGHLEAPRKLRLLDLCAGTGRLSWGVLQHHSTNKDNIELTCLELNPDFVRVGQAILPDANWVQGSFLNDALLSTLGRFDLVISNPPFAKIPQHEKPQLPYNGNLMEYAACQVALQLADEAVFILPQHRCPFEYSGKQTFRKTENRTYEKFSKESGIKFEMNCGIDTKSLEDFQDTNVVVEIVHVERELADVV